MTDLLDSLAKPPPPPSELDELMSRDPLDLSAQDIDAIIAFQRQARARREAGPVRKARAKASDAPSGIDLVALVTKKPTPQIHSPTSVPGVVNSLRRI